MAITGSLFHLPTLTEEYLAQRYPQVEAREFYRDLFPAGELEKQGEYAKGKYCGIAVQITSKKVRRHSVTDELSVIDELVDSDDFCVMSPVSYAGKSQKQSNARWLYAVVIDLDNPIEEFNKQGYPRGISEFFYEVSTGLIPLPTYIVTSGTGLHIYYMLERPIPLYRNVIEQLQRLRHDLIFRIWNRYISSLPNPQYESVTQGFRMVGTVTKLGDRVRAYRTGERVSIEKLNTHVLREENKVTDFFYKSSHTLEEAREKFPEWYQRRIVEGKPRGSWQVSRALYDWWKTTINDSSYGHRYFWVMALAIYATKCGVSEDELIKDALSYVPILHAINEDAPFTKADAIKACQTYNADYQTFPRRSIERITAITIPPNRRNGRKQEDHLKVSRFIRDMNDEMNGTDWRYHGGAPTKEHIVREWRRANPGGSKIQCERETGLSRPTVLKWWDSTL